jgi:hypothetical protein
MKKRNRLLVLILIFLCLLLISGLFCACDAVIKPVTVSDAALEEEIHNAVLGRLEGYLEGELRTEGHALLSAESGKDTIKVYAIASYNWYGFQNDKLTTVSGSGAIPAVMEF